MHGNYIVSLLPQDRSECVDVVGRAPPALIGPSLVRNIALAADSVRIVFWVRPLLQ